MGGPSRADLTSPASRAVSRRTPDHQRGRTHAAQACESSGATPTPHAALERIRRVGHHFPQPGLLKRQAPATTSFTSPKLTRKPSPPRPSPEVTVCDHAPVPRRPVSHTSPIAWTVAHDWVALYQLDDPVQARTRAEKLIADLRECPIAQLARLGAHPARLACRAVRALQPSGSLQRPNREPKPEDQEYKRIARGFREFTHYRLRLLLNHGRIRNDYSPTRIENPRSQLRCEESFNVDRSPTHSQTRYL